MRSVLRTFLLVCCVLLSLFAEAKKFKAPKWKSSGFVTTSSGIRANIVKPGKGPKPKTGDHVRLFYTRYESKTKAAMPPGLYTANLKRGDVLLLDNERDKLEQCIGMLSSGGEGFFVYAQGKGQDSACWFIRLAEIMPTVSVSQVTGDTVAKDSVSFVITDPAQKNRGDSLFTLMQLVEVPKIIPCGPMKTIEAFRFRRTWFDNGVQHQDILIYIECPEKYGKDFFVAGANYMVTAIPLLENHKQGKAVYNLYQGQTLESYLCLRLVRK